MVVVVIHLMLALLRASSHRDEFGRHSGLIPMMAVSRQRHGVGYKNSRRMRILSQGDHQMRHTAIAACLTNLLLTVPVAARDTLMSAAELASFCSTGNSACEFYLQGAWDGIEMASKNSGTPLVCAPQEPNAFQLKNYFTAAMLARSLAGKDYGAEPAIGMVYSAFTHAMPCKQ